MRSPRSLWQGYATNARLSLNGNIIAATALGAAAAVGGAQLLGTSGHALALVRSMINALVFVVVHALLHYAVTRSDLARANARITGRIFFRTIAQIYATGSFAIGTYLVVFWLGNRLAIAYALAPLPSAIGPYLIAQLAARAVHTVAHRHLFGLGRRLGGQA